MKISKQPVRKLRILLNLSILLSVFGVIYFLFVEKKPNYNYTNDNIKYYSLKKPPQYDVWLIFTRVTEKSPLKYKFHNLLENILNTSSIPLKFNIIVDNSSKQLAVDEIFEVVSHSHKPIYYKFYDVEDCAKSIADIVSILRPHFSSKPGTYYSDALFYISLGLHRIAPQFQSQAIVLDCDLYFKKDIKILFNEFDRLKPTALFALAPELTPVYRHVLQNYKAKHNSTFGEYFHYNILNQMQHPKGFQGYNSGVVLINLSAIRKSKEYKRILTNGTVQYLVTKYNFKGHLGDQDFYTLIGFEYPHLIQTLNCGFNRQLCLWWRDHGYREIFDLYFKCKHPTVVLHGNCNTRIPK